MPSHKLLLAVGRCLTSYQLFANLHTASFLRSSPGLAMGSFHAAACLPAACILRIAFCNRTCCRWTVADSCC